MSNCQEFEPLVTACIDGAATDEERRRVDAHLSTCRACRGRAEAERSVRALLRNRAPAAFSVEAPEALRARCLMLGAASPPAAEASWSWRDVLQRVPVAAMLAFALTGALIYLLTVATPTTLAAQLTMDHVKCFTITGDPDAPVQAEVIEAKLSTEYGWTVDVPGDSNANDLRLVGSRRCLYGEGTIAHILYRHNGAPLSLFMLPDKVHPSEIIEVMGHAAIIWPARGRTFVLLGGEPRDEMEKIASYIQKMVK
jgi:anti-sigma factor RsiW